MHCSPDVYDVQYELEVLSLDKDSSFAHMMEYGKNLRFPGSLLMKWRIGKQVHACRVGGLIGEYRKEPGLVMRGGSPGCSVLLILLSDRVFESR